MRLAVVWFLAAILARAATAKTDKVCPLYRDGSLAIAPPTGLRERSALRLFRLHWRRLWQVLPRIPAGWIDCEAALAAGASRCSFPGSAEAATAKLPLLWTPNYPELEPLAAPQPDFSFALHANMQSQGIQEPRAAEGDSESAPLLASREVATGWETVLAPSLLFEPA